MPTKAECIAALQRAGTPPERAAALLDAVLEEKARVRAANPEAKPLDLARALEKIAEKEARAAAMLRRTELLTIIKRDERQKSIAALQKEGLPFRRALLAGIWGDAGRAAGSRESAARLADAYRAKWLGRLAREMDAHPELAAAMRRDKNFDSAVRREMEGQGTGNENAAQAARILSDALEETRLALNAAGANIGRLENYAPHNHDPAKLLKAGQGAWVERMLRDLDWEKTDLGAGQGAGGQAGSGAGQGADAENARAAALSSIWTSIVTGRRPDVPAEPSMFRKPGNMAGRFGHERTLHFRDAESSAAYHAEFGSGTALDATLARIERSARSAGMMEMFGPNPEIMLESLVEGEKTRLRRLGPDEIRALASGKSAKRLEKLERKIAAGGPGADAARQEWDRAVSALQAEKIAETGDFRAGGREGELGVALKILLGETGPRTPTGAKIAGFMRGLRQVNALSSLGSAVIAAIGDAQTKALWFRHNGENIFESLRRGLLMNFEGLQSAEKKEIGRALGFYAEKTLAAFHSRFTDGEWGRGLLAENVERLFRVSGLNAWTEANQAACGFYLSNRLARNADKSFAELDPHYAVSLRRAGLEDRWDLLREIAAREADGEIYILPENARKLEGVDEGTKKRLELDLLGYIHDETAYAVIEPDAKSLAVQTFGGKNAGTLAGETGRAVMQFKSFPIAYFQRILREQRWLRAADSGAGAHAAGMAFAAGACALFGYVSITARDLTRGREPRDPARMETVLAAVVQGGGLSIWGDFLLGRYNRWGGDMLASAAGPTASAISGAVMAANLAAKGEIEHGVDALARLAAAKMPYANLWWAKSALDYGMFFHLREWMSPGTLARSERALRRDFNQQYLRIGGLNLRPSRHVKKGGGFRSEREWRLRP